MAHAFDGPGFGRLLLDAERLLFGARDYEQRLASLVAILEGESAHVAISATPIETAVGLLAIVGQLRHAAGEHRQLAERLLTRLVGQ
jgi:hypothetical protein